MKTKFTLLMILPAFLLISGISFAQTTNPNVALQVNPEPKELPKIVRSGLEKPQNFMIPTDGKQVSIDNKGTEFWITMPRNFDMYGTALYLDITSDVATNGTVEIPGLIFSEEFSSVPGEISRITLPELAMLSTNETIENKGIHITAMDEVTVYGLSIKGYTSDCFLALPVDILSTQYLVMSYPNLTWTSSFNESTLSQFSIVSPYDNNRITITPTTTTLGGSPAGTPMEIILNEGETYQVRSQLSNDADVDLTGSIIQSSLPVALLSGNSCASIPQNTAACDIIVEQIPPVSTWGNNFVTYPLEGRENGDTWRILSSQNNNNIYIDGELIATLNFGDFYENIFEEPKTINSAKPVIVMQFSNGDDYDPDISLNGDPFMMLIPPEEQFMDNYTFATPSSGFIYNYVTVTIPTEGIGSLMMDSSPVSESLFNPIGNSGYSAAGIEIEVGSHTLSNTDNIPFGIYAYGFNNYDSYGYAGGLSLEFIYEGSAPVITRTLPTIQISQNNHSEDEDLLIEVNVEDNEEPYTNSVILYYSSPPGSPFVMAEMDNRGGDIWSYIISNEDCMTPGINFYFTATDGQLTSSAPSVNALSNPYSASILPNELPLITHDPIYDSPFNTNLEITAEISDITDYIDEVLLHYRVHGGNPVFTTVEMSETGNGSYQGTIPENIVTESGTDYYISAKDNFEIQAIYPEEEEYVRVNQGVGIEEQKRELISISCSPNPVSFHTKLAVTLKERAVLTIELYDARGQKVRTLFDSEMAAGEHHYSFYRGSLKSGTFFLKASNGKEHLTYKLILL
ncbi:MAG: T9SS type A sorting domain-containing protein [Bacteroidales bacterium]|nr:T9SS type A sorting domain-containing protein [Bacteroidales bacterium]